MIFMAPSHTRQERLLLLYGSYARHQAAAEYVTNGERLAELRKALLAASPDKKPPHLSLKPSFPFRLKITSPGTRLYWP